jgi:hypothetical protein
MLLSSTERRRSEATTPRSLSTDTESNASVAMRSASSLKIVSSADRGNQFWYTVMSCAVNALLAPPACFHRLVELAGFVVLRTQEHHVLEEMRQPGDSGSLVARADTEERVHRQIRDRVIRPQNDAHAVGEGFGRDFTRIECPGRCHGAGDCDGAEEQGDPTGLALDGGAGVHGARRAVATNGPRGLEFAHGASLRALGVAAAA